MLGDEASLYRWRKKYGGMNRDQLKRLKELETKNQRLRRTVSDLTLDSEGCWPPLVQGAYRTILTEAARGSF